MSNFEDLSFYWGELTSEVWNIRGVVLTWQELVCGMRNFEDLPFCKRELTSEVCTRWGVLKLFSVRDVVLT